MKKYFSLVAGFILLAFTACQSDELANGGRNGEVAALSVCNYRMTAVLLSPVLRVTELR